MVTGVCLDSRSVVPGDLYAALPGANVHGASFVDGAAERGARAVLTDASGAELVAASGSVLPVLVCADPRAELGDVAARVYGTDTLRPRLIGVTGTNGKTTTAYLLAAALEQLGERVGLIGTVETRIGDRRLPSARTTPEAPDLHALLALMSEEGVTTCVMEVSSHALAQHRVDGLCFDRALFTNLSQDHLDFHGGMEEYFLAKAELFTPRRAHQAVVWVDDAWGERIAGSGLIRTVTVGYRRGLTWQVERDPADPARFTLRGGPETLRLRSSLPGDFNIANTALAAATLLDLGVAPTEVEAALAADPRVPGRMEIVTIDSDQPLPRVVVDYAHTPEAIRAALEALRASTPGLLVCVTGAGGDRDRDKRAAMGAAATAADIVVITDDNPRSEDPSTIREAVLAGARSAAIRSERPVEVDVVAGRAHAIEASIARVIGQVPTATVAVVGKGHESGQEVSGVTHPFDDRDQVRQALRRLTGAAQ